MVDLNTVSITQIKGIGEKTALLYQKLGIESVEQLCEYFPKDYIRYDSPKKISELEEGMVCGVLATVCDDFYQRKTATNLISTVTARDESGRIHLAFFRLNYLRNILKFKSQYVFYGKVIKKGNEFGMEQPAIIKPDDYRKMMTSLQPVYPLTKGLTSKAISKQVEKVLQEFQDIPDCFSYDFLKEYQLTDKKSAIKGIHFPKTQEEFLSARKRLVFEEFYQFFYQLKRQIQNRQDEKSGYPMIETAETQRFLLTLPYALTNAQINAFNEIKQDLCSGYEMNRLLQGDVGSGKTIVAILSMLLCVTNGYQSALMAPTEVLATQHFKEIVEFTNKYHLPFKAALLTGSTSVKQRREILSGLKSGEINAVIGTHALISEDVEYYKLGLVITDEQHRFGVNQREEFQKKGKRAHVLVMSATPIPRTLACLLYADLQISVIDEMPQNRKKILSCVIPSQKRASAFHHIYEQIKAGHQAYIICPMIEENEDANLENVHDYPKKLKEYFPAEVRIGVLHGRMKNAQKNQIMHQFETHNIDILVSTTVIEVGINVPNATVIMIENAERFGLAALHQLRGRVGRGEFQSYCIFMDSAMKDEKNERLKVLEKSTDGFFIANEDLRLRGPGDILGIRQSGEMLFKIGDIFQDRDLMLQAKTAVEVHDIVG